MRTHESSSPKRMQAPSSSPWPSSAGSGLGIEFQHAIDLFGITLFSTLFYSNSLVALLILKCLYCFIGWTLKMSNYEILLYFCSKFHSSNLDPDSSSVKIKFYIKKLAMATFVNDVCCFLVLSYDQYTPPKPTDTIWMLIPRWMGAAMVLFNIVYKIEYLRETPFAWLDIYFTKRLLTTSSSSRIYLPRRSDYSSTLGDSSDSSGDHPESEYSHHLDSSQPSLMDKIPHPNYSIGCIGYYGMALYTQSYTVLFHALLHHCTHILFLFLVERPVLYKLLADQEGLLLDTAQDKAYNDALHLYFNDDLIIFKNLDLLRSADAITVFVVGYTIVTAFVLGREEGRQGFFMWQALFWRVVHTHVLGFLLYKQKTSKFWTRYFLRRGDGVVEAFKHWKLLHNLSLTMTYCSFFIYGFSYYKAPLFTYTDTQLLRHIIGTLFILLHVWMTATVYQVTGPLAWFHAEFFIDMPKLPTSLTWKRTKQSPFKYFEHPLLYTFSCWGVVLICERWELFWVTLFGQISHILFLLGVKGLGKGGMAYLLGFGWTNTPVPPATERKREESGGNECKPCVRDRTTSFETDTTVATFHFSDDDENGRNSVDSVGDDMLLEDGDSSNNGSGLASPSSMINLFDYQDSSRIKSTIKRVVQELEGLVGTAKPHVEKLVQKTRRSVVNLANAARIEDTLSLGELPTALYSLEISTSKFANPSSSRVANISQDEGVMEIPFGSPLYVQFTGCRETMKRKDWIGIYPLDANFDPTITTSTCGSKWTFLAGPPPPTSPSDAARLFTRTPDRLVYYGETLVSLMKSSIPGLRIVTGQVYMNDLMIPWKCGAYEVRYHHDGKYNVVTRSKPFRIALPLEQPRSQSFLAYDSSHLVPPQVGDSAEDEANETSVAAPLPSDIVNTLLPLVKTCLGLGSDDEELDVDEGILARVSVPAALADSVSIVKCRKLVSQRIVYVIASIYKVDFSWKAVENLYSIRQLAARVHEALTVL